MTASISNTAAKFDPSRASEYASQSRIALAGYDACHELAACVLAATLGSGSPAHILVAGAGGTAQEIITAGKLEARWRFTAVDPSPPMLDLAISSVAAAGMADRTETILGYVDDLDPHLQFDAATLIGVLHHIPSDTAKLSALKAIGLRLKPGAPLVLACNYQRYASQPILLAAWGERWRMAGSSPDGINAKLGKILQGADPPDSEAAVAKLLAKAGFGEPLRFFSSLFWGAWITRRMP